MTIMIEIRLYSTKEVHQQAEATAEVKCLAMQLSSGEQKVQLQPLFCFVSILVLGLLCHALLGTAKMRSRGDTLDLIIE